MPRLHRLDKRASWVPTDFHERSILRCRRDITRPTRLDAATAVQRDVMPPSLAGECLQAGLCAPRISAWMSCVPSYVFTVSRFIT